MDKINGYRELSAEEVIEINEVKQKSEEVRELIEHLLAQNPNIDERWVAIAEIQLQLGFMALNRAVARPTTF